MLPPAYLRSIEKLGRPAVGNDATYHPLTMSRAGVVTTCTMSQWPIYTPICDGDQHENNHLIA